MANIRIILYTSKTYSDGTHPVALRIVIDRKQKLKTVGRSSKSNWSSRTDRPKRSHPHYNELTNAIEVALDSANHNLRTLIAKGTKPTADMIFGRRMSGNEATLDDAFASYIETLGAGGKRAAVEKVKQVRNDVDEFRHTVLLSEIDKTYLSDFYRYLIGHGLSPNTIHNKVKVLKTLIRRSGDLNSNAFRYVSPRKDAVATFLTLDEIALVEDFKGTKNENWARDTFLLQFYTWGARVGDALTWRRDQVVGNRLIYESKKNDRFFEIELSDKAMTIIDRYDGDYLLPWVTMIASNSARFEGHIKTKTAQINKHLKIVGGLCGIRKRITTHVARHSFAHMCVSKGLKLTQIRDLLGHSSVSVTSNYLRTLTAQDELNEVAKGLYD